ncbi:MAG: hypothetical protein K2X09_00160, partial [Rickettsiales bacterium]|nr:hypothetical protein [Rickettsiales bacterium]
MSESQEAPSGAAETAAKPTINAAQSASGAQASASASVVNHNHIEVRVVVERPRGPRPSKSREHPSQLAGATQNAQITPDASNTNASKPSASPYLVEVTPDTVSGRDVTRYVEKKIGKDGTVTVTGSMRVTTDASHKNATIVLHDANGEVVTHSNLEGATGYRNVKESYGHVKREFAFTPGTDDALLWGAPKATCGVTKHDTALTEITHNQKVNTYSEVALRNFFDKHPGLADKARKEDIPLTFSGGRTVNLEQIE